MLLPLFFTQILYPEEWKKYWVIVRPIYYIFLISLVVFQMVWALLAALDDDADVGGNCFDENGVAVACFHTEYSNNVFRAMTAMCFIFLAVCQGVYAVKISNLDKSSYDCHFLLSPKMLLIMNSMLVLSFITKGFYQFGAIFEMYFLPDIPLQGSSDVDLVILLTFELWEYLPTLLLVLAVTSKSVGGSQRVKQSRNEKAQLWRKNLNMDSPEQAALELSERRYGSVSFSADDDLVSICSDANSFTGSSFERGNQGRYMKLTQPVGILPGRFEAPSSLSPKSSWLPVPSGSGSASYEDAAKLAARSFSVTPDSAASMSASSSFLHTSSFPDKASRRSDQYMVSLRQNMRRGASEDNSAVSPAAQYSISLRQSKVSSNLIHGIASSSNATGST